MSRGHGSGDLVAGRYRLTDHIASGGMGEVWKADDEVLQRPVAVKLLTKGLKHTEGFDERFRSEARHSAQLHHHNIAAVHDFGEDDEGAWLVMEYVPGRTVAQLIRERGPLPPQEVAQLLTQAARALGAAHTAGVVHRDVKPANVIVSPAGVAKLTDFGISRAVDGAGLTRTGEVMGTAQYLAPEQLMGRGASPVSDLYSLGVVAHEMLTGERPYERESVVATAMAHVNDPIPPLPESTPPALAAVVVRLMAKDPAERPQNARDLVAMLENPDAFRAAPAAPQRPAPEDTQVMTRPVRRSVATTQGHPIMRNLDPAGAAPTGRSSTGRVGRGATAGGIAGAGASTGAVRADGPGTGGTDTAPEQDEPRRRGFPWLWLLAALVLLALLVGMTQLFARGEDEPAPVTTVTSHRTVTSSGEAEESSPEEVTEPAPVESVDGGGDSPEDPTPEDSGQDEPGTDVPVEENDEPLEEPTPDEPGQDEPTGPTTGEEHTTGEPVQDEPTPSTTADEPAADPSSDDAPTTDPTSEPAPTSEPDPTSEPAPTDPTSEPAPTTEPTSDPTTDPGPSESSLTIDPPPENPSTPPDPTTTPDPTEIPLPDPSRIGAGSLA